MTGLDDKKREKFKRVPKRIEKSQINRTEIWSRLFNPKGSRVFPLEIRDASIALRIASLFEVMSSRGTRFYVVHRMCRKGKVSETAVGCSIDPLHKWRLNLNNNTWYIRSLIFMLQDKGIFT